MTDVDLRYAPPDRRPIQPMVEAIDLVRDFVTGGGTCGRWITSACR